MSGPVIPELCLICYENLSPKELKSRTVADLEQIQGTFSKDAIFILKVLLQVPEHLLEGFCVSVEDKIPPGLWISVCNRCSGAVEEAKLVYQQILELCAKFRDARGQMVEKVRESCGGGGGGGRRGRSLRKKGNENFLKRIAITEECRKFVNERTFDPGNEEAFVVEDVALWTSRFLARLELQKSAVVPQTVIIFPDYQEEEVGGETLINLDPFASNQNADDLMAVDDKDPLSFPEDDNLSTEDKEPFDIEVKDDVDEVKSEASSDKSMVSSDEGDNDSEWEVDEMEGDGGVDDGEAEVKTISKNLVLGGDRNECPTCHKEVRTEAGLRMHLHHVHKVQFDKPDKNWTCSEPNCDSTFTDYREYQHHVLCHKKGEPPDKCETCGKGFFGFKGLRYHCKLVHDIILQPKRRPSKPRLCPTCGATIKFPETFQDHMRTVHDKSDYTCVEPGSFPCTWENCDKVVTTLGSLRDHVRRHHQNLATVICEECGAAFFTHNNRRRHRLSAKPVDCKVCGETLASCHELGEHRKAYHPVKKEKRIDKRIKNPGSRPRSSAKSKEDKTCRPRRSPDKKEAYQCYQCGKPFKSENNLKDHLKFVHEGNYDLRCHLCGKGLRERLNLTIHLAREHNVTEDGSGQLPQCPVTGCRRVFPGSKQLEAHMTKFHGESGTEVRYQCGHCGKGFQSRYKFEQHEMTHTNAESRPVKCDICGKGFSNQHNMRYHQLNTHKVERKIKYERKRKKNNV